MVDLPEFEKTTLVKNWIDCAKNMNRWEIIKDMACATNQKDLLVHSLWNLAELVTSFSSFIHTQDELFKRAEELGEKTSMMGKVAFSYFHEHKLEEVNKISQKYAQKILTNWLLLPKYPSPHYDPLLDEVREVLDLLDVSKLLTGLVNKDPQSLFRGTVQHSLMIN